MSAVDFVQPAVLEAEVRLVGLVEELAAGARPAFLLLDASPFQEDVLIGLTQLRNGLLQPLPPRQRLHHLLGDFLLERVVSDVLLQLLCVVPERVLPVLRHVVVDQRHLVRIGVQVQILYCRVRNAVVSFDPVEDALLGLLPCLLGLGELLERSSLPGLLVDLVEAELGLVGLLGGHCEIIARFCGLFLCFFRDVCAFGAFLIAVLMVFAE